MFPSQSTCVVRPTLVRTLTLLLIAFALAVPVLAQQPHAGGEANLVMPDLDQATFLGGIGGRTLLMGGLAIAGPSGLLAWSENLRMLDQRKAELKQAQVERDDLKNRVALLDPNGADPDLAGELVRRDLNVVHQDEMVMILK